MNILGKSHKISLFATVSHGCKGKNILRNQESWLQRTFFSFATVTDGCKEANFMGFSHEYGILDTTSKKFSLKMGILLKKFLEIILFATVGHGCKGENILRNHDSWFPSR